MKSKKSILAVPFYFALSAFTIIQQNQKLNIAAASDLKFAMDSIVSAYKAQNPGVEIEITYGSSGKFFEQIINDAPFDIFFSADIDYPNKLKEKNFTISDIKTYGIGQIVLWSKKIDPNKKNMNTLLDPRINKIAIANPGHAPYGKRAEESLQYYKLYEKVQSRLVFGENISQTAQYVITGTADIGIVALSLALSPNMKSGGGKYYIIPEESHKPLEQAYAILKHGVGNSTATKFCDFVSSGIAVNILNYYGFSQKVK